MLESVPAVVNRERIRTPRRNNQAVINPVRSELVIRLERNRERFQSGATPEWIRILRFSVRREAWEMATRYADTYLAPSKRSALSSQAAVRDAPWILGGHQPELFHAGVWFKNFLIDSVAKETEGLGFHCIVDHDLARSTAIKAPCRDESSQRIVPRSVPLPLQTHSGPIPPWHDTQVDLQGLNPFQEEVDRLLQSVGIHRSLVQSFVQRMRSQPSPLDAARAFSQFRHALEQRAGLTNLDLPMSDLCSGMAWHEFLYHCFNRAEELHRIYNQSLAEYREREGITNAGQPVASLGRIDDWIEMPFWLYDTESPTRQRMWMCRRGQEWWLASGTSPLAPLWTLHWPIHATDSAMAWQSHVACGLRIRPRALMTTLFLRCFAADLFVHGIGGGVYDRLTDDIIRQFLEIEPPEFVICTATMWLPMEDRESSRSTEDPLLSEPALQREEQWLRSRPETFLDRSQPMQRELAEAHAALLAAMPPRGQKRAWHHQMVHLKNRISDAVSGRRATLGQRRHDLEQRVQELRWLESREYAFVLYEESDVVHRLAALVQSTQAE